MMITLTVNGKEKELPENTTVLGLIEMLELNPKQVAVEVNREIVKRDLFSTHILYEDDEVELLHFVGGGSL
jgi:sulfur carrier protein